VDCDPNSDRSPTVFIEARDTLVVNTMFSNGCTIADRINAIARSAENHGQFASGVAHLANELRDSGLITGDQKGIIQKTAAGARIP
jgi:hypothetical protein